MRATSRTLAVVLAAGGGTRFEGSTHKLLAPFADATVLGASVGAAVEADIGGVIVVEGAVAVGEHVPAGVTVVTNDRWAEGQATSLQRAVREAEAIGVDAIVVGLGDQPGIGPDAWRKVAASSAPIAVASYSGRIRNPVRLHRSVWSRLPDTGDEGARSLIRGGLVPVERIPCSGDPHDIDTQEDLRSWS